MKHLEQSCGLDSAVCRNLYLTDECSNYDTSRAIISVIVYVCIGQCST